MNFSLVAEKRQEKGEKSRDKGFLPAVVYGAGSEAVSLNLSLKDFVKLYEKAGGASLIDLSVDKDDFGKVLIQSVQYDPVKGFVTHVDFRKIDMNKPMTATVELNFVGEAPIIKSTGGTLVHNIDKVTVKCLPKDLISSIEVDLSGLISFEEVIKVKDLKISSGIEIISPNADDLVCKATPAMTEEELKALEQAADQADITKVEVAGEKKEEAEGETEGEGKEEGKKEDPAKEEKK